MINLDEINTEIDKIIAHGDNYEDCKNLATLLICRAGLERVTISSESQQSNANYHELRSGSEFAAAVSGKKVEQILVIFDELMGVLQSVNPHLYEGVMIKIREASL